MKMSVTLRQHFWKTKMCPLHLENKCKDGSECDYAHSAEDLRTIPDLKRTKLCYKILKGEKCFNKQCSYAHSQDELKSAQNLFAYKSSMCKFIGTNKCLNGSTCRFAHSLDELRNPKIPDILLEKNSHGDMNNMNNHNSSSNNNSNNHSNNNNNINNNNNNNSGNNNMNNSSNNSCIRNNDYNNNNNNNNRHNANSRNYYVNDGSYDHDIIEHNMGNTRHIHGGYIRGDSTHGVSSRISNKSYSVQNNYNTSATDMLHEYNENMKNHMNGYVNKKNNNSRGDNKKREKNRNKKGKPDKGRNTYLFNEHNLLKEKDRGREREREGEKEREKERNRELEGYADKRQKNEGSSTNTYYRDRANEMNQTTLNSSEKCCEDGEEETKNQFDSFAKSDDKDKSNDFETEMNDDSVEDNNNPDIKEDAIDEIQKKEEHTSTDLDDNENENENRNEHDNANDNENENENKNENENENKNENENENESEKDGEDKVNDNQKDNAPGVASGISNSDPNMNELIIKNNVGNQNINNSNTNVSVVGNMHASTNMPNYMLYNHMQQMAYNQYNQYYNYNYNYNYYYPPNAQMYVNKNEQSNSISAINRNNEHMMGNGPANVQYVPSNYYPNFMYCYPQCYNYLQASVVDSGRCNNQNNNILRGESEHMNRFEMNIKGNERTKENISDEANMQMGRSTEEGVTEDINEVTLGESDENITSAFEVYKSQILVKGNVSNNLSGELDSDKKRKKKNYKGCLLRENSQVSEELSKQILNENLNGSQLKSHEVETMQNISNIGEKKLPSSELPRYGNINENDIAEVEMKIKQMTFNNKEQTNLQLQSNNKANAMPSSVYSYIANTDVRNLQYDHSNVATTLPNGNHYNMNAYMSKPYQMSHMAQIAHMGPMGQIGQVGQIGQRGQIGQMGQMGQMGQVGQMGQMGHMGQIGQMGQMGQMGQIGHIRQIGQMRQIGQLGQMGQMYNPMNNQSNGQKNTQMNNDMNPYGNMQNMNYGYYYGNYAASPHNEVYQN